MNKVIDLGKARGKLRKQEFMTLPERNMLRAFGNKDEKKQLERIERKEQFRYGGKDKEKTMKVLAKEINNPVFTGAIHRLDQCSKFSSPQATWNAMKLIAKCREAMVEYRGLYKKMVSEFCEVDEKGEIKLTDKHELIYKEPKAEMEAAHQKKFEEFMSVEIDIQAPPLALEDACAAGLAPIELDAIKCLVDTATVPNV